MTEAEKKSFISEYKEYAIGYIDAVEDIANLLKRDLRTLSDVPNHKQFKEGINRALFLLGSINPVIIKNE